MKTVTYQCNHCSRQFNNVHEILEISCNNNSLAIINNAKGAKLKTLSLHSDLHFCSQSCLNSFLFHPLNSTEIIVKELERLKLNYNPENSEIFINVINFLNQNTTINETSNNIRLKKETTVSRE